MTALATRGEIPIPALLGGYAVAAAAYAVVLQVVSNVRWRTAVWFLVALGVRAPWLFAGLSLSDDAWRYLHDGRAQLAGVNPYRYPPAAAEARVYAGPEYDRINHRDLPTIYPPGAQWIFGAGLL